MDQQLRASEKKSAEDGRTDAKPPHLGGGAVRRGQKKSKRGLTNRRSCGILSPESEGSQVRQVHTGAPMRGRDDTNTTREYRRDAGRLWPATNGAPKEYGAGWPEVAGSAPGLSPLGDPQPRCAAGVRSPKSKRRAVCEIIRCGSHHRTPSPTEGRAFFLARRPRPSRREFRGYNSVTKILCKMPKPKGLTNAPESGTMTTVRDRRT